MKSTNTTPPGGILIYETKLLFLHPTDNDLRGRHRFYRHRKMSFPAVSLSSNPSRSPLAFHHQNLHFPASLNESKELISDLEIANRRYRRFSNVSDAVSRKLSTTIGKSNFYFG